MEENGVRPHYSRAVQLNSRTTQWSLEGSEGKVEMNSSGFLSSKHGETSAVWSIDEFLYGGCGTER